MEITITKVEDGVVQSLSNGRVVIAATLDGHACGAPTHREYFVAVQGDIYAQVEDEDGVHISGESVEFSEERDWNGDKVIRSCELSDAARQTCAALVAAKIAEWREVGA
tara:strand:+ start:417 stop:743 length:327 start_codon:yes stop_codon:yes gene_type:complete